MKIRAKKEIAIEVDKVCGTTAYIHAGEEFNVHPTSDGMKFKAFGYELSPYDFVNQFELID